MVRASGHPTSAVAVKIAETVWWGTVRCAMNHVAARRSAATVYWNCTGTVRCAMNHVAALGITARLKTVPVSIVAVNSVVEDSCGECRSE